MIRVHNYTSLRTLVTIIVDNIRLKSGISVPDACIQAMRHFCRILTHARAPGDPDVRTHSHAHPRTRTQMRTHAYAALHAQTRRLHNQRIPQGLEMLWVVDC